MLRKDHHQRHSDEKGLKLADQICNIVKADACRSMRSIATELRIGKSTVRWIIQEDLR